jgi:hypothetical protein
MHLFGWMIADPICSIFIAILIALSVSVITDPYRVMKKNVDLKPSFLFFERSCFLYFSLT